jgi:uncharacterized protein YbaR (Trm112 family)
MHSYLIEMLQCPSCQGSLSWTIREQDEDRILVATADCAGCRASYPIEDGIGIFLTPDLPRDDLWEEGSHWLSDLLRDHPDLELRLMDVPLSALGPADLFHRGLVHEERKEFDEAHEAFKLAWVGLYTEEYHACSEAQFAFVIDELRAGEGPLVDLASGRCYLVAELARALTRPIVATDFSPRVLRRDHEWLTHHNLYEAVSLLAFDARRTPFRDGVVEAMTTNLGLPNIREPGKLLKELRRIVSGRLLAISHFFPEDDEANLAALREHSPIDSMLRKPLLAAFADAGWQANIQNEIHGLAEPTPVGEVIEGGGIDALPVAGTILEWCVIDAS